MEGGITVGTDSAQRRRGDLFTPACPTRWLLDRIGGKWVVMAITLLAQHDELGFAELDRRMPGVTHKMLSQTLRTLVTDGIVARRVEPSRPPRVHYRLTALGHSLQVPLAALRDWAEEHVSAVLHEHDAPGVKPVSSGTATV